MGKLFFGHSYENAEIGTAPEGARVRSKSYLMGLGQLSHPGLRRPRLAIVAFVK